MICEIDFLFFQGFTRQIKEQLSFTKIDKRFFLKIQSDFLN